MTGAIASSTTLRTALFLIPVLTAAVAVGTAAAKGIQRSARPTGGGVERTRVNLKSPEFV